MGDIKEIAGVASSLFVLIGALPYIRDIHFRRVHPHVLSWLGWGFLTALGASAMLAEGSEWAVAILLANTLACFGIALYATVRGVGTWESSRYDVTFFGLGVLGLILWQVLDLPLIALVCAVVADFCFGMPTVIKTWKDSSTETPFVWVMATLSGIASLFALRNFTFSEAAYPVYLFCFDLIVLLLVIGVIRKIKK
jgi:hypothetical protein